MKNAQLGRYGFTLVELLVVVLIIGILASVALPQYNKAVRRARFSEVATTFNSFSKAIDVWLLENGGYPDEAIFTGNGTSNHASLDIEQSCATEDAGTCYTKVGQWYVFCHSDDSTCHIRFNTSYNADGSTGNTWLKGKYLTFVKRGNGTWGMDTQAGDVDGEICRWWKDMYGKERITSGYGATTSTACDAY